MAEPLATRTESHQRVCLFFTRTVVMRRRIVPLLLLIGVACWSPRASAQAAKEIKWRYDYSAARIEAKEKNLPLFLDVFMDLAICQPCARLERVTFQDPRVVELLADKFVCLKINGPKEETKTDGGLVKALNIDGFPTLVMASPDGKILQMMKGFQEPQVLAEQLQRIVGTTNNFDWMLASLKEAQKAIDAGNYRLAIPMLVKIKDMGEGRPAQTPALNLLNDLEQRARAKIAEGKKLQDKNMTVEALQAYAVVIRDFPGLAAARDAEDLVARVAQSQDTRNQERTRQARELLAMAKDFFKNKEYELCLNRCERLRFSYGDLPEAQEATQLALDIRNNPAILEKAAENLSDQLGTMYLQLADSYLKKGQRQQAINYLERVIIAFPGSTHAESAQIRRAQLQVTTVPAIPARFNQGQ
jgi:thioredoxin-related protein